MFICGEALQQGAEIGKTMVRASIDKCQVHKKEPDSPHVQRSGSLAPPLTSWQVMGLQESEHVDIFKELHGSRQNSEADLSPLAPQVHAFQATSSSKGVCKDV